MFTFKSCTVIVLGTAIAIYQLIPAWKPLPIVDDLVSRHGYGLERHYVTTSDGFVLEHHRLLSRTNNTIPDRVIILNHGLLDSSNMWVLFTPDRSLGFYLADRGYDVWLLNGRGNAVSRKHLQFSENSSTFWNHSWHEIAIYDLPASIDYILDLTKTKEVDFVGFSMGSTTYFAMASELPKYTEKLRHVVAMAPSVFNTDLTAMIPHTSTLLSVILTAYSYGYSAGLFGEFEVKGSHCDTDTIVDRIFCASIKYLTGMIQDVHMNPEEYGEGISYIFGGSSSLSLLHYHQTQISGRFAKFDYGTSINNVVYGQPLSPDYDLRKCKNQLAIFWSDDDLVAPAVGVQKLISSLPNVTLNYKVPVRGFRHAAFFAAKNTESIVNEKLYEFLRSGR